MAFRRLARWPSYGWCLTAVSAMLCLASMHYVRKDVYIPLSDLDFGEVWATDDSRWRIAIRNPTCRAVSINQIFPSCPGVVVSGITFPATLAAGETLAVPLRINLLPSDPEASAVAQREIVMMLTIDLKDHRPIQVGLHGRVRNPFKLPVPVLDLGEIHATREPPVRAVRFRGAVPLASVVATCSPEVGTVLVERVPQDPGEFVLRFQAARPQVPGPFLHHIMLHAIPREARPLPPVKLPVRGCVSRGCVCIPDAIELWDAKLGATQTTALLFQGPEPLDLQEVRLEHSSEGLEIHASTQATGDPSMPGPCRLSISVTARCTGFHSATLVLRVNDSHTPVWDVRVPVMVHATESLPGNMRH